MEITLRERKNKGYAMAKENGKKTGLMTYSVPKSDFIIIEHTEVNEAFRGLGVGKKLLYKIVHMAREKNLKVMPLCPFAHAQFKKLHTIQDVLKS